MSWQNLHHRAYVPYSKNPRSCIIQGSEGGLFAGVRIENISFPITISALQAACCICLSEGETPVRLYAGNESLDQLEYWKKEFNLEAELTDEPPIKDLRDFGQAKELNEADMLKELLEHAVSPNSDFPVSALLYTEEKWYTGVNVEVSDWSMGLCAERVALAKAFSSGDRLFRELAVHTKYGEVSSPCGACRQVILEHFPLNKIRLYHTDGSLSEHFTADLLPFSFTSRSLIK